MEFIYLSRAYVQEVEAPTPDLDAGMLKQGGLAVSLDYDSAWTSAAMQECDKSCSDDVAQLLATKAQGAYLAGVRLPL